MVRYAVCLGIVFTLVCLCASAPRARQSGPAASDFDGDAFVGFEDFLLLAKGFGKSLGDPGYDARLDLNGDDTVGFEDFLIFARNYGRSSEDLGSNLLYVADLLGGRLVVINTVTNLTDLSRSVDLSQPRGLAFSPAEGHIYVAGVDSFYALTDASLRTYQLPLLDPPPAAEESPVPRGGFKVALSDDRRMAFVTEEFVGRVEVIGLQNGASLAEIAVGPEPVGIAVVEAKEEALVAGKGRWLHRIDTRSLALEDSIALEGWGNGRLAVSADGALAYTARTLETSTPSVQIVAVDLQSSEVVRSHETASPNDLSADVVDLALSADGRQLLATVQRLVPAEIAGVSSFAFEGDLIALDVQTFVKSADLRLGERVGAIGISFDGRSAYVGGVASVLENSAFRIYIVDLQQMTVTGSLSGFELPADIRMPPAKQAGGLPPLPEFDLF